MAMPLPLEARNDGDGVNDSDAQRQCFVAAELAVWCGCGAIFDQTVWRDCPRCAGSSTVCAEPLIPGLRLA